MVHHNLVHDVLFSICPLLISVQWSGEYGRLVHRFCNTIAGQFYGHTHTDEFEVFFGHPNVGESRREAENVLYIAPSQTPINGVNPSYRIYIIDGKSNEKNTNGVN